MALCAWAGVLQGALHSEAGAAQHLLSQLSREEAGPVSKHHRLILYGSAKLQLSKDTAVGQGFVGRAPMCGC